MTLDIVEARFDSLLANKTPKVLMLTGGWGAGKTHQWKEALKRTGKTGNGIHYAYISLFGLTSLAELRKRIAEETVAALRVPGNTSSIGEMVQESGWQFKPLQLVKLLPIIPYLGKLEGLANELSFSTVRNIVVCFDDLERGGASLRLADVFGLASFLKEERHCRVVLISNQEKLRESDKADLQIYLEKVVDETVHFAPTSAEACDIALGRNSNPAGELLRQRVTELNITNIRVISRLKQMVNELEIFFENLHENVIQDGVRTLTLFGAAHFLSSEGYPSMEYLGKLGNDWSRYSRNANREETDEDRKLTVWDDIVDRYQYGNTSVFDAEIGKSIVRGYFDKNVLIPLAGDLSKSYKVQDLREKYQEAWDRFWNSINGDSASMLEELYGVTCESIGTIGVDELQHIHQVFTEADKGEIAENILNLYIDTHPPEVLAKVEGAFRDKYSGAFGERLRNELEKHRARVSIEEALDRIDFGRGWDPADIKIVGKAEVKEIERILRSSEGRNFRIRLRALLHLGTLNNAEVDEKRVSRETLELLQKLAKEDPLMEIRMRRHIPNEADPAS